MAEEAAPPQKSELEKKLGFFKKWGKFIPGYGTVVSAVAGRLEKMAKTPAAPASPAATAPAEALAAAPVPALEKPIETYEETHRTGELIVFGVILFTALITSMFIESSFWQWLVLVVISVVLVISRYLAEKVEEHLHITPGTSDPLLVFKLLAATIIVLFINNAIVGMSIIALFFVIDLYGLRIWHRIFSPQLMPKSKLPILIAITVLVISGVIIFVGSGWLTLLLVGVGIIVLVLILAKPQMMTSVITPIGLFFGYFLVLFLLLVAKGNFGMPPALVIGIIAMFSPIALLAVNAYAGLLLLLIVGFSGGYTYAYGPPVPGDSPAGEVFVVTGESVGKIVSSIAKTPSNIETAFKRQMAIATGDYAASQIDADARKELGVYLERLKAAEERFFTNAPASFYTTLKAQALDKPINIVAVCKYQFGSDPPSDARILSRCKTPRESETICRIDVEGAESYDVDCDTKDIIALRAGTSTMTLTAEFDFTTRSYLPVYMIERGKLRDMKRRNLDPLQAFDVKSPVATTTKGPIRVGIAVGEQPVAIEMAQDTPGPTIALTVDNAWDGEVKQIKKLLLFVPKGLEIKEISGARVGGMQPQTSCAALQRSADAEVKAEARLCDDTIVTAYLIEPSREEPFAEFVSFRMQTIVKDGGALLGPAPVTTRNMRAAVIYSYILKESKTFSVEEPRAQTRGETQQVQPPQPAELPAEAPGGA